MPQQQIGMDDVQTFFEENGSTILAALEVYEGYMRAESKKARVQYDAMKGSPAKPAPVKPASPQGSPTIDVSPTANGVLQASIMFEGTAGRASKTSRNWRDFAEKLEDRNSDSDNSDNEEI